LLWSTRNRIVGLTNGDHCGIGQIGAIGIGTDIRTGVRSLRTDQTFLTRTIAMKVRGFNNTDIRQQQDQARNDKKVVEVLSHWANGIGSPDKLSTFTQAAHP
jgi:hypothetical protein